MRSITEESRLVMNTRRNFVNYARVTLADGTVLNLTPADFRISGNTFTDDWVDGEAFQIGTAIGKTATLLLDNTDGRVETIGTSEIVYPHGKFSNYDFYLAYFELYIHLPNSTTYQGELIDEIITIGTFTVTQPVARGATIEIIGVDNMCLFDKPFDDCTYDIYNNGNGRTLKQILNRCCVDCLGISFTADFTNQSLKVYKKPEKVTYREVVSWIAQMAGCNAKIDIHNKLVLQWYNLSPFSGDLDGGIFDAGTPQYVSGDTADGGSFNPWEHTTNIDGGDFTTPLDYHNLTATNGTSVGTDDVQFTGVMISYEVVDNEGNTNTESVHLPDESNWDTYAMKIEGNPFIIASNVNTVINTIWNALENLRFRPFSCSSIQDPTIEAGDCALVYDVKGNTYPTIITNVKFTTGGMTEISCNAQSPVSQNSRYVNPAARAEAKAKEQQDNYNTMVDTFNKIAFASTSYYKTVSGNITYLHNKPTLAASDIIVKITGDGAFISTDGGQSYNAGVDVSNATMLMNFIYVKGIQAEWIDVDKLSAISAYMGDVQVGGNNDTNGTLKVYPASGSSPSVTLDKNGITAVKGYIGNGVNGWTIGNTDIHNGCTNITDTSHNGTYVGTNGIRNQYGSYYVQIYQGKVSANRADITGDIKATSGWIGTVDSGWHIGSVSIYNGCTGPTNASDGTYVGVTGIRNNLTTNGVLHYVRLYQGTLTANNVDIDGGDINMSNGKFHVDSTGHMTCSNVTITGAHGSASADAINLNGVFKVTNAGALTASSASITGTITATGGVIGSNPNGRWTIGGSSIYNGCTGVANETAGTYIGIDGIRNNWYDSNNVLHYTRISGGSIAATDVNLKGTITATGGTIGSHSTTGYRWVIGSRSIYNGCNGVDTDAAGTYVGTDGIRNQSGTGASAKYVRIKNGELTANAGTFSGTVSGSTVSGSTITGSTININERFKVSNQGRVHIKTQGSTADEDYLVIEDPGGSKTYIGGEMIWSTGAEVSMPIADIINYVYSHTH